MLGHKGLGVRAQGTYRAMDFKDNVSSIAM